MPIAFDYSLCDGCGICDGVCPGDVIHMAPPVEEGADPLPVLPYADECWHCGSCRQDCPTDAITIVFPPDMLSI